MESESEEFRFITNRIWLDNKFIEIGNGPITTANILDKIETRIGDIASVITSNPEVDNDDTRRKLTDALKTLENVLKTTNGIASPSPATSSVSDQHGNQQKRPFDDDKPSVEHFRFAVDIEPRINSISELLGKSLA